GGGGGSEGAGTHPATATTISTRMPAGRLLPSPPARTKASAQASTSAAAMPATAHTGSDTTPVKSRAVADSPTRSSMSHYSANSMAQGGGGGHPPPAAGSRSAEGTIGASYAICTPDRARAFTLCARSIACAKAVSHFAECVPARNAAANSARKFELAFPGHALERLIRILDAVLVIGAVGGEQL